MKKTILMLAAALLFYQIGFAQTDKRTYRLAEEQNKEIKKNRMNNYDTYKAINTLYHFEVPTKAEFIKTVKTPLNLLLDPAFTKLVKRDIAFAVVGAQSPTPGLSLDVSDITSFKVTGNIPSKRKIVTLDVTATQAADNVSFFSNGKFNAQFSAGLNFHIIPSQAWRPIPRLGLFGNTYSFRIKDKDKFDELTRADDKKYSDDLLDQVAVLGCFMKLKQPKGLISIYERDIQLEAELAQTKTGTIKYRKLTELERVINKKAFEAVSQGYLSKSEDDILGTVTSEKRRALFFKLIPTYFPLLDGKYDTFTTFRADLALLTSWEADSLSTALEKACQDYVHRDETKEDAEIERSQPLWTRKKLNWFTITAKPAFFSYSAFSNDSTAKPKAVKSSTLSFFEFGIPLWYQLYDIRKAGGNLLRLGITLNYSSNKALYQEAQYIVRDTLITYPNNTVQTETITTGIYNDGTRRQNKFYANYYAEFYRLPRKNFVPGYSIKLSLARTAIFGDDTKPKFRLELGSVLNILTSEKDKTVFTIQPYVALSNLLDETKADGVSMRNKTFAEKTSAGIRVGVPIRQQLAIRQ